MSENPYRQERNTEYQVLSWLIRKRERLGGVVTGIHGTSASRARQIMNKGFDNAVCIEGGYASQGVAGVYFWDDTYGDNAWLHARARAEEDGETEMAIITAKLAKASPDQKGRYQWFARAENIEIIDAEFRLLKP